MKKISVVFFVFLFLILNCSNLFGQFRLGRNPENPARMPDPKKEMGVVLNQDSPIIKISGANGTEYTNFLSAGTLVIADKISGIATWVAVCGNRILTSGWKPEGKVLNFSSQADYKIACEDMLEGLDNKLSDIQEGVSQLLLEQSVSYSQLEELMRRGNVETEAKKIKEIFVQPLPSWTAIKTFIVGGATIGGAVIGGFGFKKTETHQELEIIPGVKFQTGDGTIQSTPDRMKTFEFSSKKFNPVGALIGAGLGLVSSLLVFSL